jgi:Arc/MetJ-type ribon-helix-helix transcriptional regulator
MHKTTLYLPEELEHRLRDESRRTGRSQAELIRDALSTFLSQSPRELPRFVGMADDPGLDASDAKAWVRNRWGGAQQT